MKNPLAHKARQLAIAAAVNHGWITTLSDATREATILRRNHLISECRKFRAKAGLKVPSPQS